MKETKYTVKYTTSFKKDYKRAIKRGLKIELLEQVVALLAMGEPLPDKNRDHDLSGDWAGHRECHILPDWLLVYRIEDDTLPLTSSAYRLRADRSPEGSAARSPRCCRRWRAGRSRHHPAPGAGCFCWRGQV